MPQPDAFAAWLSRGAGVAREDARRIARELVMRGDISEAEAAQIEAGVAEAVERGLRFVQERVAGPLQAVAGGVLSGVRGDDRTDEILARLEALDARLARLERRFGPEQD